MLTIKTYQNGTTAVTDITRQATADAPRSVANPDLSVLAVNTSSTYRYDTNISFRQWRPSTEQYIVQDSVTLHVSVPLGGGATDITVLRDGDPAATVTDGMLAAAICTADGVCTSYCDGRERDRDCTCGDGVCQAGENVTTCLQDCAEATDQTTTLPNETREDGPVEQDQDGLPLTPLAGLLLVGVVAALLGYWYVQRRQEEEDAVYSDMPERY